MKLFFSILIVLGLLIGEIMCIVKFFRCDFEPSYKAEFIYGIGMCTGVGAFVGYMDFGK